MTAAPVVTGTWIECPATQGVLAMLESGGFQALCVGGCVRDALLGRAVADVDIATDARPDTVLACAARAGLRAVPTGLAHGTVTVIADGAGYEVTTFRRDIRSFGRHAEVAFSTRIEEDAARRDFTMNALYARRDGTLVDPLDGLPDLLAGRVRFVGDPDSRIREDYLRILRFFRFAGVFGVAREDFDKSALAACGRNADGIDALSRERVGSELRKLLAAENPVPAMDAMAETGVLPHVLPGARVTCLPRLIALERQYRAVLPDPTRPGARAHRFLRRLAVLGASAPGAALRLSRAESRALRQVEHRVSDAAGPGKLGYRLGEDLGRDVMLVRSAVHESELPAGWHDQIRCGAGAVFPLRAADLAGGLRGRALGDALRMLEEHWIASHFTLDRAALVALSQQLAPGSASPIAGTDADSDRGCTGITRPGQDG